MLHIQQTVGQSFRGHKVKRLANHINLKCHEYFVPHGHIAVDGSTIGFKERVSWKYYNPNKPRKWGLRVYTTCDSASGYIMAFVPYYEKFTTDDVVKPDLPFTIRIVLELCNMLFSSVNGTGYHIFTNCFYTSPDLCEKLRKMYFRLTGTVMVRRKAMPTDLATKKKRKQHGVVTFRKDDNIMALLWKDKCVVTMLYNMECEEVQRVLGSNK